MRKAFFLSLLVFLIYLGHFITSLLPANTNYSIRGQGVRLDYVLLLLVPWVGIAVLIRNTVFETTVSR